MVSLSPVDSKAAETITVGGDQGTATTAPPTDTTAMPVDTTLPPADPTLPPTDATAAPADTAVQPTDTTKAKGKDKTVEPTLVSATAASSSAEVAGDPSHSTAGPSANTFLFTGAATASFPIAVPPGRKGIAPALALSYNSYQQNGWVGVGWGLDMGAIQRSTKNGVRYSGAGSDEFVVSVNGSTAELVPRSDWGANYYGAKIEGEFTKYYRDTTNDGWQAIDRNGTIYFYGKTTLDATVDGRQTNTLGTFKWCLVRVQDANGNYMKVSYWPTSANQGALYLKQIDYTGNSNSGLATTNRVVFELGGQRIDTPTSYSTHWPVITAKLLTKIEVSVTTDQSNWQLARRYVFSYNTSASSKRSMLAAIVQYGSNGTSALPATTFTYSTKENIAETDTPTVKRTAVYNQNTYGIQMADVNGDGKADLVYDSEEIGYYVHVMLGTATGFGPDQRWGQRTCSYNTNGGGFKMADVDGDGKADLVYDSSDNGSKVRVLRSTGQGFEADAAWGQRTASYNLNGGGFQMVDLNRDGKADLIYDSSDNGSKVRVLLSTGTQFNTDAPWGLRTAGYNINGGGFRMADVSGDGRPDLVYDSDTNGSYVHVLVNTGSSFETDAPWGKRLASYNTNGRGFKMADVNGDGLADLVYDSSDNGSYVRVLLNTGAGFATDVPWGYRTASYNTNGSGLVVTDINGDGLTDLIYDSSDNGSYVRVLLGTGASFLADTAWGKRTASYASGVYGGFRVADMNGDGLTDVIYDSGDNGSYIRLLQNKKPVPDLLTKVSNGMGGATAITYGQTNIPGLSVMQTVTSITTNDGYEDLQPTSYSYSGGYFDFAEREFRGFASVTQTNPDGTKVRTGFHQDQWRKGRQNWVNIANPSGNWWRWTIFTWESPTTSPAWAFIKLNQKSTNYMENGYAFCSSLESYLYDSTNGLPLSTTTSGIGVETVTTATTYWKTSYPWFWQWRPATVTVTDSTGGQLRKTIYDYWPNGSLKSQEGWLKDGINPKTEILSYDNGNPTEVKDARGYVTTTKYDTLTHTYPIQVTSPATTDNPSGITVNHSTGAGGYDYRFGVPTWTTGEEGDVTSYTYDTFGRLTQVDFPDGGQTTTSFNDQAFPRDVMTTVKEDSTGQTIAKHTYYDGLGRPIQTTTYGEGGKLIVSTNTYDTMGRLYQSDGPFFPTASGGAPANHPWIRNYYDDHGRLKTISGPDSNGQGGIASTTFSYSDSGLSTTVTDPDNKMKTEYKDALGRLIKVVEYSGSTQYATTYAYNPAGDLLTVTDAQGNVTTMTYDTLGRKKGMIDPDMGTWRYTYDQNGNLNTQTDAKSQTITFIYDQLNRPMSKSYTSGDPTVTYLYDNQSYGYATGRLFSVSNGLASNTFTYDSMGRVKNQYKTISGNATTFITRTTYDLSGKVTKQTYPDNFIVTYAYYPGSGLLKTVTGSDGKVYATYTGYEPTGKIGEIGHGNGTETRYTYDPASTRLTALVTDDPAGLALQNKVYQYSQAGDVSKIIDQRQGVTYNYTYDTLHRLTQETNTGQLTPSTYTYDEIGNIKTKVAGTTLTYTPSTTHKHAVGKITVNSTAYTFSYDANGNLYDGFDLTNLSAIAARHITYNADNMPLQITRGGVTSTITYDGNGARAKKVGPNGTIYYVGPHYEIDKGVTTKYILAGGERIAKVVGTTRYYFHKDHLGSATILTSDAGTTVERTDYLPFGEMRSHSGSTVTNYKFTGQELDPETGLYNYNARLYDPVLGKFTSADTIVPNFSDPQSLNRYSYCRNNPLNYVDPSGHFNLFKEIGKFFDTIISGVVGFIAGGPPGAAIAISTNIFLSHTNAGQKVVQSVADEVFDDMLGLNPRLAYLLSNITLNAAMDWGLYNAYHALAGTPTARIDWNNRITDLKDPKYTDYLQNMGKSGDVGANVWETNLRGGGVYPILDSQDNLIGLAARDGATSLTHLPNVGINHLAVVVKGADGIYYNSMKGFTSGNLWGITATCQQISNQAIQNAGYALTVNSIDSGWFSYATAAVYGPLGSSAPASSYYEWKQNKN